jgi:hypothetical protein
MLSSTASLSNPTIIGLRVNDGFNEFTKIVDSQLLNQGLLDTIKLDHMETNFVFGLALAKKIRYLNSKPFCYI